MSMLQMLDADVHADPYPFYAKLRESEPVRWDAYLHTWVITSYAECVTVLSKYKAGRTPTPDQLDAMGLSALGPYAELMLKQMMFMDAPAHARLRALCSVAFTPRRVEMLRGGMQAIAEDLLDAVAGRGEMDLVGEFAELFPAMATTALLGIPAGDHPRLKVLSTSFSELMGNFDHEPERLQGSIVSLQKLQRYFQETIDEQKIRPREGLITTLLGAEIDGSRLADEEIIANLVLVLVGGFEESTNLIGSGMLTLLKNPESLAQLRENPEAVQAAVEELLRFEAPSQHTGRVAAEDLSLGGMPIRQGDSLMVVLAAANRDPLRFLEPDRLDLTRQDNRHLSFGWAAHYCFGSPLARMSAQIAFNTLVRRLSGISLAEDAPVWRENIALRGLKRLRVNFKPQETIRR